MKLKIDFNGVNMLLTRSRTKAEAETANPLLTINKGGSLALNKAFADKYLKDKPKQLYFQIGWAGEDYFLFLSKSKQQGFYAFNSVANDAGYIGTATEARKYLGSKKTKTVFKLTPAKVEGAKLKGFKLEVFNSNS